MIGALVATLSVIGIACLFVTIGLVIQAYNIDFLRGPSGPSVASGLKMTRGTVVLVGGAQTENLGINAFPANATVLCDRAVVGGATGHYTAAWNNATGILTITSSSGTDTSTVAYLIIG